MGRTGEALAAFVADVQSMAREREMFRTAYDRLVKAIDVLAMSERWDGLVEALRSEIERGRRVTMEEFEKQDRELENSE